MIDIAAPFILLDDAREQGALPARLYRDPAEVIVAHSPAEVRQGFGRLREARSRGLHAAGFFSYEAGLALEPRLEPLARPLAPADTPLLWFGLFEEPESIEDVPAWLGGADGAWASPPRPLIDREAYADAFATVQKHILAGDIYQANLTFGAEIRFGGDPVALYAALRSRARAGHGALIFTGRQWLLSFSPELFFETEDGRITARPMKGTARRHSDADEDRAAAEALARDEKQRAENLMIVDLMRNDLSRVSQPGSVEVPSLFRIEAYPTVHQMTSTVTALLSDGRDAIDLLLAAFPCGSITGAPKIRAMEIIAAVERTPRRIYTGAIGSLAPSGDASFNVAIRTLSIGPEPGHAVMGLGSGVVADSRCGEEWRECMAKGGFVSDATDGFDLIETMAFDPQEGIVNLDGHLERMKASAEALGFVFDRHEARNELQAATFNMREARKLRLRLARAGAIAIETRRPPDYPEEPVEVALAPLPFDPSDFRLRHKTSDRGPYDDARRAAGTFEVLFTDAEGFLTEGSFTNVFVERGDTMLTPPLSRPLLPGVLRAQLIAAGHAREADLRVEDLADGFLIGNALRGLIRARLA